MPEVSLVAILDADKEGFLRSETSMVQDNTAKAARNGCMATSSCIAGQNDGVHAESH